MQDFRDIQVWQKPHEFALRIYRITAEFPKSESYGLVNQMRRAATSIPTNIAEGCVLDTDAQFARYLQISLGSASELDYHLLLARDLGYLSNSQSVDCHSEIDQIKKMLASFIKRLRG